jgi:hypothetical protein
MFSPDGLIRRKIKDYAPNFWFGTPVSGGRVGRPGFQSC